jgi:uncharacterized protein with PIN domain
MTETLSNLESEVEKARAKLIQDLSVLRSPQTYREFTADVRSEARSVIHRVIDNVKARAAANPSAVLAISAGIAWRLLKDPPIATALVGAGALGLWRTQPIDVTGGNYLGTARERFREQVGEAVDTVKDYATEAAVTAQKEAASYARAAGKTIQDTAVSAAADAAETLESARAAVETMKGNGVDAAQRASAQFGRALDDRNFRDQMLLGAAGIAVAAALGLAYQRRLNEDGAEVRS